MPKRRLDEARVLAAVAANDPPASADHLDDDEWHAAQDMWLVFEAATGVSKAMAIFPPSARARDAQAAD